MVDAGAAPVQLAGGAGAGRSSSKAEGNPFFLEELTRSLLERQRRRRLGAGHDPGRPHGAHRPAARGAQAAPADRLGPRPGVPARPAAGDLGPGLSPWRRCWRTSSAGSSSTTRRSPLLGGAPLLLQARPDPGGGLPDPPRWPPPGPARGRRPGFRALYADRLEDVYDSLAYHCAARRRAGEGGRLSGPASPSGRRQATPTPRPQGAAARRWSTPRAAAGGASGTAQTVELVLQLAASLLPLARFPEKLELLWTSTGERVRAARRSGAGGPLPLLAGPHPQLSREPGRGGEQRPAARSRRRGGAGTTATEGKACYVLSRDAFWAGRFAEGIGHGLQAVALLERSEERWWQGQAYWVAGFHQYVLGQFEEAFEAMARARGDLEGPGRSPARPVLEHRLLLRLAGRLGAPGSRSAREGSRGPRTR